jgi:hypothetical protein
MIPSTLAIPMPLTATVPGQQDNGGAHGQAQGTPEFLAWMQSAADDMGSVPNDADATGDDRAADAILQAMSSPSAPGTGVSAALQSVAGRESLLPTGDVGLLPLQEATSVLLDSDLWRDFLSARLELHVCNARGEREVIAMPWRLMASGHLAQSAATVQGIVADATSVDTVSDGVKGRMPAATQAAASGASTPHPARGDADRHMVPFAPVSAVEGAHARDKTILAQSRAPHAPAAIEWVARWMKWIERDGRDAVVWLRDFRVDDEQATRLADGLRRFAEEQGVSLERIVVNGRERWRNQNSVQFSRMKE